MLKYLREKLDSRLYEEVEQALSGETAPRLMEEGALSREEAETFRKTLAESQKALTEAKRGFALGLVFEKAGALDSGYLRDTLRDHAEFDGEGKLINGEALLQEARERHPGLFPAPKVEGVRPAESFLSAGVSLRGLGYAERAKLYAEDPEAYRRMRGG